MEIQTESKAALWQANFSGLPQKIAQQDFVGRGGTTEHNARRRLRRCVKSEVCADESIAHYTLRAKYVGSARLVNQNERR